jgi:hypothetical protein
MTMRTALRGGVLVLPLLVGAAAGPAGAGESRYPDGSWSVPAPAGAQPAVPAAAALATAGLDGGTAELRLVSDDRGELDHTLAWVVTGAGVVPASGPPGRPDPGLYTCTIWSVVRADTGEDVRNSYSCAP